MARVNTVSVSVTTAGTAVPLSATDLWVSWFVIEFDGSNSGTNIYRGATADVDSTYPAITSSKPFSYAVSSNNQNLKEWYIDADSNGDSVWVTYGIAQEDDTPDII